jgi:hypothetical protein
MLVLVMEGIYFNYASEMGSDPVIYIPSFIMTGSGIHKLIRGTHRPQGDPISLLLFFQNKESRLKIRHFSYFEAERSLRLVYFAIS